MLLLSHFSLFPTSRQQARQNICALFQQVGRALGPTPPTVDRQEAALNICNSQHRAEQTVSINKLVGSHRVWEVRNRDVGRAKRLTTVQCGYNRQSGRCNRFESNIQPPGWRVPYLRWVATTSHTHTIFQLFHTSLPVSRSQRLFWSFRCIARIKLGN